MTLSDLPATQLMALSDACAAPMPRCRGGFRGTSGRAHTVRCCNALRRNGMLTWTDDSQRALMPSPAGRALIDAALAQSRAADAAPQQAAA